LAIPVPAVLTASAAAVAAAAAKARRQIGVITVLLGDSEMASLLSAITLVIPGNPVDDR